MPGDNAFEMDDLDRAILKVLPPEGSKHGTYLPDGRTIKQLIKLVDPSIPTNVFAGRVMSMRYAGLVVGIKGATRNDFIYQVTPKGKAALKSKDETAHGPERKAHDEPVT